MMSFLRRTVLIGVAALAAAAVAPRPAAAVDLDEAKAFVAGVADSVVALSLTRESVALKTQRFRDLLTSNAATLEIARVSLGQPWRSMNDAQKDVYVDVFIDYVSAIYARRFDELAGQSIRVTGATDRGRQGVFVSSQLLDRAGGPPTAVEWRVTDRNGSLQILDVYFEGVSLVVTQRSEFSALLESERGDIDAFIQRLRERSAPPA